MNEDRGSRLSRDVFRENNSKLRKEVKVGRQGLFREPGEPEVTDNLKLRPTGMSQKE